MKVLTDYVPVQSCLTLCDSVDCSLPGPAVLEISQQEYWSGLLLPPPGDLPDPEIGPQSSTAPALAGRFFTTESVGKPLLIKCLRVCVCMRAQSFMTL